jgi:transcriptional regulator of acetoin/glycerol metabolism
VILCKGDRISARELPISPGATKAPLPGLGDFTLEELEKAMVQRVLAQHEGNVSRAANALGLSRAALYRRMEKFGLG